MERPAEDAVNRPFEASLGAALLYLAAAVLLLAWATGIDAVTSNGARVFFVVLWAYLGYTAWNGFGWARHGILAVFVAAAWGLVNAPSLADGMAAMTGGETVARLLALVALVSLWLPAASRWFSEAGERRSRELVAEG